MLNQNEKKEQRKSDRNKVEILVEFKHSNNTYNNFSYDLSEGGMFIETENVLNQNENIDLKFKLIHENVDFTIKGRVAWVRKEKQLNQKKGMGIEFLFTDNNQKKNLNMTIQLINKINRGQK